jgi:hypothetical protein
MDMNERLNEGDIVAFDSVTFFGVNGENGIDRYILAPYVEGDYILVDYSPNTTVDYIISAEPDNEYNNYTLIKKYYSEDRRGIISVAVETILSPGQSSTKSGQPSDTIVSNPTLSRYPNKDCVIIMYRFKYHFMKRLVGDYIKHKHSEIINIGRILGE